MKPWMGLLFAGLLACSAAYAADTATDATKPAAATNSQQDKMKDCNTKAADMKGDDRKAFMKTCLSAKPAKPQSKMAECNAKTKGMSKPDADKARSECMKG
jgi:hypothetical protein